MTAARAAVGVVGRVSRAVDVAWRRKGGLRTAGWISGRKSRGTTTVSIVWFWMEGGKERRN